MRALVLPKKGESLQLRTIPTPDALPGSVIVKVLAAHVDPHFEHAMNITHPFTMPPDLIPGGQSIGRVAAIGPDTTSLSVGQLVMLDSWIRARDNPDVQVLWGIFDGPTPQSKKFMADNWTHASFAEYVRAPLENCWALNEKRLCGSPADGGLGYTISELIQLPLALVAYGGLRGIDVKAGETVVVAPATGMFSGAAVGVAMAMGANVIAVSRNLEGLKKMQATYPRVNIVQLKGDVAADTAAISAYGPVDAYIDISPAAASDSTHVRSCMMSIRQYGRASLMGVIKADIAIPNVAAVFKNLTIRAQYMYERADVHGVVKLAESGLLKMGKEAGQKVVGEFRLEDWEKAFEAAANNSAYGNIVTFTP